ncbi:uncharacterized protein GGS25DRAFT_491246 [Hypoxylon fragiforme]|uniref:uncharacterized protein n=1 Tax=Hypoxylon fragiforme TaxID=63214 RepID=UPI0020C5FDB9|nr:uncharacterized protein GGS25DRAFT_491246 [Hypoxylon fragiforme]KAI2608689.1 hypothetical protein GGS25DRAFT_491246 [Hypoxylon fragiforme]
MSRHKKFQSFLLVFYGASAPSTILASSRNNYLFLLPNPDSGTFYTPELNSPLCHCRQKIFIVHVSPHARNRTKDAEWPITTFHRHIPSQLRTWHNALPMFVVSRSQTYIYYVVVTVVVEGIIDASVHICVFYLQFHLTNP